MMLLIKLKNMKGMRIKMINKRNNSGITLIVLVVTIIVILILAGITIDGGTKLIKRSKIESLITNMITIKANAKVYAEEINAKIWDLSDNEKKTKRAELFSETYNMEIDTEAVSKVDSTINDSNGCEAYKITKETLETMGLSDLANESEDGEFVVVYNSNDFNKLEIVYPSGVSYENSTYWTLTALHNKIQE